MKRTLLAVCGLSPQVITETLFALHQQGRMVDAVRVLTTRQGKDRCISQLFGSGDGAFLSFLDEYAIPRDAVDFAPHHVRVLVGPDGAERGDITDEDDNELFLRVCMDAAFEQTRDPERIVFFSLSGGRKTMSACLAIAAQFYARPQDRLFHVLVSPEFENSRDFFFPHNPPREIVLYDLAGKPFRKSTEYAQVNLASLPFVTIRDRISPAHLKHPELPADLLASLVREPHPELTIDLREGKVCWKGRECDLPASYLAVYVFFVMAKKEAECGEVECGGCRSCFLSYGEIIEQQERVANLYRRIAPRKDFAAMKKGGIMALDEENLRINKAKINAMLARDLGALDSAQYEIAAHGRPKRFGIALTRERIRVVS